MSDKTAPERIWLQTSGEPFDEVYADYQDEITWCQDPINEGDVEYIRADLAKPRAKQLEWSSPWGDRDEQAYSPVALYTLVYAYDGRWELRINSADCDSEVFETNEAAKAAAQADFERRVMECLE